MKMRKEDKKIINEVEKMNHDELQEAYRRSNPEFGRKN